MLHYRLMNLKYKRLLLKLSGEQLAGDHKSGIDPSVVAWIAQEIKRATDAGAEVAVLTGGGNMVRGAEVQGNGIRPITAHNMGMLSGVMNSLAVADIFNDRGLPAHNLTNIKADQIADQYTERRASHHLHKGRVVVIGGGIARPYFTHDTGAVNLALELECDVVCKVTKVNGVYDKDPVKYGDAKRLERLSFQKAVEDPHITVMDKAALGLAMEQNKPVVIFDLHKEDNIRRVVLGEDVGTVIQ